MRRLFALLAGCLIAGGFAGVLLAASAAATVAWLGVEAAGLVLLIAAIDAGRQGEPAGTLFGSPAGERSRDSRRAET